jgi:hypothetical protein
MRNYPNPGDYVRIKETGEVRQVKALWKPRRVLLDDDSIFYLGGVEPASQGEGDAGKQIAELVTGVLDMLDVPEDEDGDDEEDFIFP